MHGAVLRSSHLSRPDRNFRPTCLSQGTSVSSFRTSFDFTFFSFQNAGKAFLLQRTPPPTTASFSAVHSEQMFSAETSSLLWSEFKRAPGCQLPPGYSWSMRSTHTPSSPVPSIKHALHLSPSAPLLWANGSCPQRTDAVLGLHILGACLKGP